MSYPVELRAWAMRHHVGLDALAELGALLGAVPAPAQPAAASEARVQSQVRLAAPYKGMKLWRNNVGVLPNPGGVPVRYGLANDSPGLNKRLKSSDLIGWRRVVITPAMVGSVIAQFVSIECKREGWKFTPGDDHDEAQYRWLQLATVDGGYGKFITDAGEL